MLVQTSVHPLFWLHITWHVHENEHTNTVYIIYSHISMACSGLCMYIHYSIKYLNHLHKSWSQNLMQKDGLMITWWCQLSNTNSSYIYRIAIVQYIATYWSHKMLLRATYTSPSTKGKFLEYFQPRARAPFSTVAGWGVVGTGGWGIQWLGQRWCWCSRSRGPSLRMLLHDQAC